MGRVLTGLICLIMAGSSVAAQEAGALARAVDGVVVDQRDTTELRLTVSQAVPWRIFTMTDPMRLVLDFREVDWTSIDATLFDQSERIDGLRMGPFQPGWSRMVLGLSKPLEIREAGLSVAQESRVGTLNVLLAPVDQDAFEARAGMPQTTGWAPQRRDPVVAVPREVDGPTVIVLDPGHGGIDPGAEREGITEAELMLQFARDLQEVMRRTGNYEVLLTRESDAFVSLEARVAIAQAAGADLFISLHADAIAEGRAHGASVYTLDEAASDAASQALAERHERDDLLAGLDLTGADDRVAQVLLDLARLDTAPRADALADHLVSGIRNALGRVHKRPRRKAAFSVLKSADIPSVLIELGFLSTAQDLENLLDPAWRAGMAAGIRDGIEAWALEDEALARLRRQ